MNDNLINAITTLKKAIGPVKPECYWVKENSIIIRITDDGSVGCIFYEINGDNVIGTNPMRANLSVSDMKRIPLSLR